MLAVSLVAILLVVVVAMAIQNSLLRQENEMFMNDANDPAFEKLGKHYECRIIIDPSMSSDIQILKNIVENYGWRFSAVVDDFGTGSSAFCYATKHFSKAKPFVSVGDELDDMVGLLRYDEGLDVVGSEIKLIIHDTKNRTV